MLQRLDVLTLVGDLVLQVGREDGHNLCRRGRSVVSDAVQDTPGPSYSQQHNIKTDILNT